VSCGWAQTEAVQDTLRNTGARAHANTLCRAWSCSSGTCQHTPVVAVLACAGILSWSVGAWASLRATQAWSGVPSGLRMTLRLVMVLQPAATAAGSSAHATMQGPFGQAAARAVHQHSADPACMHCQLLQEEHALTAQPPRMC
jgi:hypothetical protein